jgi:hypothetical protein
METRFVHIDRGHLVSSVPGLIVILASCVLLAGVVDPALLAATTVGTTQAAYPVTSTAPITGHLF